MIAKPVQSLFVSVVLLVAAVFLGSALPVLGQQNIGVSDTTATPVPGVPHDYIAGLNEQVNPANGSLSVRIKAPAPHERGVNWPYYVFMWDSTSQYALQPTWLSGVTPGGNQFTDLDNGLTLTSSVFESVGTALETTSIQNGQTGSTTYQCDVTTGNMFIDPDGGTHGTGLFYAYDYTLSGGCAYIVPNGDGNNLEGGDEQYKAYLNVSSSSSSVSVVDLHGDLVGTLPGFSLNARFQTSPRPGFAEDTNGNSMDTTGRNWSSATTSTGSTVSVPGTNGAYAYTTEPQVAFSSSLPVTWVGPGVNGATYCKVSSIPSAAIQGATNATQSIRQPNGGSYTFTYDSVYGLINSITYPNGATVSYTWSIIPNMEGVEYRNTHGTANGGDCEFRYSWFAITKRQVSIAGTPVEEQDFSYQTNWPAVGTTDSSGNDISYKWTSKQTTVTTWDRVRGTGYQTVYTYSPQLPPPTTEASSQWSDQGYMPVENTITYLDPNGKKLKTVTKVWQSMSLLAGECETIYQNNSPIGTSGTFYTYQPDGSFGGVNPLASMTNLPTDVKEFDYSTSLGPGTACVLPSSTPIKETKTTYASFGITPLFPYPSILDRPATVQVYGNGTLLSETDYGYDQFPLTLVPAPLGQDPRYATTSLTIRGNPTTVTKKCFAGSTNCINSVTTYTYDTTGQVLSVTDPCGNSPCGDMTGSSHTTTYSYADKYTTDNGSAPGNTNAYVTKIILPSTGRTHTTTYQYGFEDGRLRNATDVENQTTTLYCYWTGGCSGSNFDPFFRLTGIKHPDGGLETVTYSDSGENPSVTVSTLIHSGTNMTNQTVYDGYAHPIHTYLSDPYGTDTVDITYDGLGRVMTKSNPYRSTSDPTYGISTYYYDALGRQVEEVEQDGSILQTCYNGTPSIPAVANCSSQLESVKTGSWVDSTDEAGNHWQRSSNVLGQLIYVFEPNGTTQAPTMETDYGYDASGNLLNVTQWGGAKGSTGARTRTFNYDSLSRLLTASNTENGTTNYSYDANSNLWTKTDARGVTVSYKYDNLNRLFQKNYSTGDASACMQYDVAASGGTDQYSDGRLTLEWTVPANTCPSTSTSTTSVPTTAYNSTTVTHDAMGRVLSERQCPFAPCSAAYTFTYKYDPAGNVIQWNNGMPASTSTTAPAITWAAPTYDSANRLSQVSVATQPWTNTSLYPQVLFQPSATSTAPGYDPMGHLINAQLSLPTTGSTTPSITQNRKFDNRGRISFEVDNGASATSAATHSLGTIAITGSEQGPVYPASAYAKATVTIGGSEQQVYVNVCPGNPQGSCWQYVPDAGYVAITIQGTSISTSYNTSSTSSSIASSLAYAVNNAGLPFTAFASGSTVTVRYNTPGTAYNGTIPISVKSVTQQTQYFSLSSFTTSASGSTLAGGTNAAANVYDAGTVKATVNGVAASVSFGSASTPQSIAAALASAIQTAAGSTVTARSDGDVNVLVSAGTGSATDYSVTASVTYDTTDFTAPSFTATAFAMQDGIAADSSNGQIYAYYVPSDGYAPNGNLLASSDSVTGDWLYTYSTLSQLTGSYAIIGPYMGQSGCWTYDPFGNRGKEAFSTATSTPCATGANDNVGTPVSRTYNSLNRDTGFTYDGAGNVTVDLLNKYLYDGEGRLCAVKNSVSIVKQYVYDASGARVAKGTLSAWPASCNAPTAANGFTLSSQYLLNLGGEAVTELTGAGAWQHSNVHVGGTLATYASTASAVYFQFTDPLGTRRILADATGKVQQTCQSLPFGNGESCPATPTEQLFTGKERDSESGNDYFGARYYASSMGRFLSPDWSAKVVPVPYAKLDNPQSLNLYAYVGNNPLIHVDADGHVLNCVSNPSQCGSDLNKIAPGTKVAADGTVQKGSLLQRIWNHLDGHGDGQSLVSSLVNSKTVTGINPNSGDANGGTSRPGVITYDPAGASITTRNAAGQLAAGWATGATVLGHELIHEYHRENGGLSPGMGDHVFTDGGQTFTEHWRAEEFRTVGFSPFVKHGDITENGLEKEMGQPQRATYLNDYQAVPQ
jgi:RHS repeat-associated protein